MSVMETTGTGPRPIAVTLLGPLSARVGEEPVTIGGPRQRLILSLLVLAWGDVVSVGTLADAVWGERPPASARTRIAVCIGTLRKAFRAAGHDGPVIATAPGGYRLLTERVSVDAFDFDALTTVAYDALYRLAGDHLGRERFEAAEELYGHVLRLAREQGDLTGEARALLGIGRTRVESGYFDEAEAVLLDSLCVAEDVGDTVLVAEVNLVLARYCRMLRRTVPAGEHLMVAHRAFRQIGSAAGVQQVAQETGLLAECVADSLLPLDLIPRQRPRPGAR